jgi:1-phosphatidylinositol phosphodiesterase
MRTTFHLAVAFLLMLTAVSPAARADDVRSYNTDEYPETLHNDWMKWVPDDANLTEMSLPGTHDTMSRYGGGIPETQSMSLRSQLNAGIRVIDIRCRHIEDVFAIHHGTVFQNAYFGTDVLKVCHDFLQDNPTETILMRVSTEGVPDEKDCTRSFNDTFRWYRDQTSYGSVVWSPYSDYLTVGSTNYLRTPRLGEVRGKVVIRQTEFDGEDSYGLRSDGIRATDYVEHVQDLWNLGGTWDLDDKWDYIKSFFRYTDGDVSSFTGRYNLTGDPYTRDDPANPTRLYENRLSSSSDNGGVWPITVAQYTPHRALQYLFGRNQTRTTGLVMMDFPGSGLIGAIIAHNLKYTTSGSDRATFKPTFEKIFNDTCYELNDGDYDDYSLTERATELQSWLRHILPSRGAGSSVKDYWSVVAKDGDRGFENWAVVSGETSGQSLFKQSDWIDDRSYVAMNAVSRADIVTTNELRSYLITGGPNPIALQPQLVTAMNSAGDCLDRARALKTLVTARFPGVRWNVAVSRDAVLGIAWDTLASCIASALSSDSESIYFYYVWAGSRNEIAPVPNAGGPYITSEGQSVTLDASASTDPDHGTLTYRWDFDNNGTWDATNSSPKVSRFYSNQGSHTVRLQVSDGENSAETTTTVTVNNVAPSLNLGANTGVALGDAFTRSCFFKDPGADVWTVTVDWGDGTPTVNVPHVNKTFQLARTWATSGSRTVTVYVNDGTAIGQDSIQVTVAPGGTPILRSFTGPGAPVQEGTTVTVNADFYYGVWTQPVTLSWGDGTPDTQPTVLATGGGNYTFTAQHIYPNIPPGSTNNYRVTATWPGWITSTLPITVVDGPPTFSSLTVPASVPEGTLVQVGYTIVAPAADFLIQEVDWGDGARQSWVGGPRTSVSPPHTYTSPGTNTITMRVTDDEFSSSVETRTIVVTDAVPTIFDFFHTSSNVKEGGTASVLGHFQSPNLANDQFTVEIDWGDGRPPTAAPYQSVGANTAEFSARHVYRDNNGANPWTATVKVTDDDGSVVTRTVAIPVGNLPPVVDAVPNFNIPAGSALSKSGNITDPGSDTFTGTVNYGDGTGTQPLSITGNSYQLNHTYAANDAYSITVNVTDDDGATASRTMKVLVGPVRDLLVTNTNDAGAGSLRQAVLDANTPSVNSSSFPNAFADIRFAPALSGQTITLTSGQLVSSLRTRILATNLPAGIQISGNNASRVLQIALSNSVVLDTIHLTSGSTPQGGGAILVDTEAGLTLNHCSISNCTTTDRGGGIMFFKGSSLKLNQCTVSGCSAREGGGIYFYGLGGKELRVENSTFSGNAVSGASASSGGAIFNDAGRVVMHHSTVVSNTAAGTASKGGGVHSVNGATSSLNNSIVAGNTSASLANISGTNSGTGNFTSGDPMLYPLGNYGGPTFTMPPRPGSPAIDALFSVSLAALTTPLAYWRLGEDDPAAVNGTTATTTSNQYGAALTFNAPVTYTAAVSPIAAGWLGSRLGLGFTTGTYGTNGLITGLDGGTALTDNFGIELWVKPSTLTGNQCLAYNGHTGTSGWGLYQFGANYGALFGGVIIFGSGPAAAGVWTHLALVRNNGAATLYVNGVASGTVPDGPNVPAGRFAIGAQPQSLAAEFFAGALDEVRVFTFQPGQFSPDNLLYQPTESLGFSYPPGEGESVSDPVWSHDQRGYPRVSNGAADIGAVEVQQSVVRLTDNAGNGSLRQVLTDVDASGIVTFAPSLSGQTITLNSELAVLRSPVVVHGGGLPAGVTVAGSGGSRILSVPAGVTVELRDLTFTGGTGGGTDMPQHGGALFNRGALTLRRCTFAGNSTSYGGVLFNDFTGALVLDQCTLSGNSAIAEAGAIYHRGVSMLVHHCTISGNQAPAFGAIYNDDSIPVSLNNTILAGNTGSNGADLHNRGTLTRIGANLLAGYVQFGVGSSTGPAAITSTPLLAALGNYGGPTQTMPPLPGSPAIDGCIGGTSFATDQRGKPRIVGAFADIGAVEGVFNPAFPLINVTALGNGNVQFSFNNLSGLSFTVLANTNLALNTWVNLGPAVEAPPGTFHFTDTQATNYPHRFYQVRGQ